MGVTAFPIVSGAQLGITTTLATKHEPGTVMASRTGDQWSIVEWVLNDNVAVINQGEVAMQSFATIPAKQYKVTAAVTGDGFGAMKGIAAATIASNTYGFIYIGGYCPVVDSSKTVATGEYMAVSGSTAAKLTSNKASVFNAATNGGSSFLVCAVAKTSWATGTGSAQIIGIWG